jgi:hypothetical protein
MYIPPGLIEPTEIIGGCIAIYKDVWENPKETIDILEKVTSDTTSNIVFERAVTLGSEYNDTRTNYNLALTESAQKNEELRNINNKFFNLTFSAMQSYSNKFDSEHNGLPFYFNEGFNVLKYQTGEEYKAHYDGLTITHRAYSPILYLNDDYTGGELEFVNFGIKIKPLAGMLVLFPSNYAYAHIAHPVKTGTKYAIVTWLHDQPGQQNLKYE